MIENTYSSIQSIKYLFITIDPSACKDRNCYVLTSMIFVNGKCIVCLFYIIADLTHILIHCSIISIIVILLSYKKLLIISFELSI